MIDGSTMLCGVIGWPVEHSRSPAIHNAAAAATGANLVYAAFPVAPGNGADAVQAVRSLGIRGLSVTMPHKADVIPALDNLTPVAEALGAVNHITNTDGHLVGNNTDGEGFLLGLKHSAGLEVGGTTVAVFGAGGAARSIIYACAQAGADVIVVARDPARAETARAVGGDRAVLSTMEQLGDADIVVNATPIGMAGTAAAVDVPFSVDHLRGDAVVVDIVYNPLETPLLSAAQARGLKTVDGLAMLVGQAAAQFTTWTGFTAPIDAMYAAARTP